MESTYGGNDWRDYELAHSWGKKPEQKKREKEYNAWYYKEHKDEILRKQKERRNSPLMLEKRKIEKRELGQDALDAMYAKYKWKSKRQLSKRNSPAVSMKKFEKELKKYGYEVRSEDELKRLYSSFRKSLKADKYAPIDKKYYETKETKKKMKLPLKARAEMKWNAAKAKISDLFHEYEDDGMEYYGNNDWRDYQLMHSWGKRPEQKKREKEYNVEYYKEHKDEILSRQKRGSGSGLRRRGEGLGSDKPISGNRDMPSLSSAQKAFRNLTDDSIDDYGEFVAEMTEQGYKFKSREEQMALWKRFRKAKGNGSVVNEENEERKLGARITRANMK